MAKRKRGDESDESNQQSNNGTILETALKSIDEHDDELASLRGSYMQKCKKPRESIREVMTEVREAGENMKAFRVLLKAHRDERKRLAAIAALEAEDAEALEDMRERLGGLADLPLGAAALDRAAKREGNSLS
jgi:xanthine dehydrogenase iron-sulfur cluster and FAD-binding subunit A